MRVRHKELGYEGVIVDAEYPIEEPDWREIGAYVRWEKNVEEEYAPLGLMYQEAPFRDLEILDNGIERAVKACL